MTPYLGPNLVLDTPTQDEREWIFASLQRRDNFAPLELSSAPTRETFMHDVLVFSENGHLVFETVRWHIFRSRVTGAPVGFFIDYDWSSDNDPVREVDIVIPEDARDSLLYVLEAFILLPCYLFANYPVTSVRWIVQARVDKRPPRFYLNLGCEYLGGVPGIDGLSGTPVTRHLYQYRRETLPSGVARFATRPSGNDLTQINLWDVLAGR